ncbi:MAG: YifB family Mg chelatase-like AAA ATPase [bacterium]
MLIKIQSALNMGLETMGVDVEINVAGRGLPGFDIVGLPSKAVDESKERVRTAITNSKIEFPTRKITVNLAPADIPKEGSFYDLPIAIGILSAVTQCQVPEKTLFFGELSFDGTLRHTRGAVLLALFAREKGFESIFVPKDSANEAAIIPGVKVFGASNLSEVLAHLLLRQKIEPVIYKESSSVPAEEFEFDMAEILGQEQAKRATEIAAAGGHNIIMAGSPGAGKTMLARALPGILPVLNNEESLEVTKIYSTTGNIPAGGSVIKIRPFRAPHHSISLAGLIGGGSRPQPGEISLAHRGVLFLDEFNEFSRQALEAMRQPIEDGCVTIARSRGRVKYPASFTLAASANPCPCGYLNHPTKSCVCTPREVKKYQKRVSGPILDRIDLHVEVPSVDINELSEDKRLVKFLESSASIRNRVAKSRIIQQRRFEEDAIQTNAEMKNRQIKKYCPLSKQVDQMLRRAANAFQLSARSYFKMIKVARTIADLAESKEIELSHMAEALQYRMKMTND